MRITGNRMIEVATAATSRNQTKVAEASDVASSGMRVSKPSDDPEAWAAAERTKLKQALYAGSRGALDVARDRLALTDAALGGVGDALSTMRELAIQAANDTYNVGDRKQFAASVRTLMVSAIDSANQQAADGEYILAGSTSTTAPFSATGAYGGDNVARDLPISDSATSISSVTGSALTAASGVDVIPLFDLVATALENNDVTTLHSLLLDIDTATRQVGRARTTTGGTMNTLDAAVTAQDNLGTHLTNEVSRALDADIVKSASDLAKATHALEAARAVTSHIVTLTDPAR